jgi:serine protease Do
LPALALAGKLTAPESAMRTLIVPALAVLVVPLAHAASAKELYQRLSPGVVCILAMREGVDGCSLGSGLIVDGSGKVLTNAHVVTVDGKVPDKVLVFRKPAVLSGDMQRDLHDPIPARIVRSDGGLDLALLELPKGDYAPVLRLEPERAVPGEPAVAIGHPGHGGLWTLTTGTVSNFLADSGGVHGKDVYQTETAVNPGNSGGPLIGAEGMVLGVNTYVIRQNEAGVVLQGLQFAVTSQVALGFLEGAGLSRASLVPEPAPAVAAAQPPPATKPAPEPIVPDLPQQPRPYTAQSVASVLTALDAEVDKAFNDLDAAIDREMGK